MNFLVTLISYLKHPDFGIDSRIELASMRVQDSKSNRNRFYVRKNKVLTGEREKYDGNLSKLYRRVYKLLNLDPSQKEITNSLREILSGLISIVSGVGSMRNKMSDAHARSYKPNKHHAELAINSARTVAAFLFDTFDYQVNSGLITIANLDDNDDW